MNKINKILAFLALLTIGCAEKEILPCNISTTNGIAYTDGKVFSGSCHYFVGENNILWKKVTYKWGKLSKEIAYYENGVLYYIGHINRDGHIHGAFTKYFRNGTLELEGQLINGYRDGNWEVYNESGNLIQEIDYEMGDIIDSREY